jgi:hypothetical protein
MNTGKKDLKKKQRLILQQKTKLRLLIGGGCILVISLMLLIYFSLTRVEEMKAKSNSSDIITERTVDMNVAQLQIAHPTFKHQGMNCKIAKPLSQATSNN